MPPWVRWEDYQAGLYGPSAGAEAALAAAEVLRDPEQFREAAREMLREWPNAALQNLALMESGRNSWLGQATCCYVVGAPAVDTRTAWGMLTMTEQMAANDVAVKVRARWERERQDAQAVLEF